MSLVKPSRLYINNDRRPADQYADQFIVRLPAPIQGLTRFSIDTALIEYNPEYPNFGIAVNQLTIKFSDVVSNTVLSIPNTVDWTNYTVNGQSAWPKNFQEYLNAEALSAGSAAVFTLTEGSSVGLAGFIIWSIAGADAILYGASGLDNTERSIMERIGFPFRLANRSIPEWTASAPNPAEFNLTAAGSPVASPCNYILGRTGCIYVISDIDTNGSSDVGLQNIISIVPVAPGTGLGDICIGENTTSIATSTNPTSDFSTVQIILLDDAYAPLELREKSLVALEFNLAYDRAETVAIV